MSEPSWLLLIPMIPAKPEDLRVKIGRRLERAGAIAMRGGVYVLPATDAAQEDFQWIRRELEAVGGGATLLEAKVVDGLEAGAIEALFRSARAGDYAPLLDEARAMLDGLPAQPSEAMRIPIEADVARLRRRIDEVAAIDFFGSGRREEVEAVLQQIVGRLPAHASPGEARGSYVGRTWVTRVGIMIDRMASAWLIRRFVDSTATFKWVPARGYVPAAGELRFDMFEAEFTHEGELCTFEVLRLRMGLAADPALEALAQIIHDLDVKDGHYGRPEAAGVAKACSGIARLCGADDEARLRRACEMFDAIYAGLTATG